MENEVLLIPDIKGVWKFPTLFLWKSFEAINKMKFTTKLYVFVFGLGLMFLGSSCSTAPSEEQATPTPIPTPIIPTKPTYDVKRGEITHILQFNARVAPTTEEELFFRSSGRVRNVYVAKEDQVSEGQILADLEILDNLERQYQADTLALRKSEIYAENAQYSFELFKLSIASPELQEATARLELAEAEKAVADAERAYNITLSTASQADIDAAYAQMIIAEEALDKARDAFKPYENKPEDNLLRAQFQSRLSAAQQRYDATVRTYNGMISTSSTYDQTVAAADFARAEARLADAQQKLELVLSGVGYQQELSLKENEVELAQISLQEARLGIQDLEQTIADAQLIAPFDGSVLSLGVSDGKGVEAYNVYAVVADLNNLEISADLSSSDTVDLEEGMAVSAVLANRPGDVYTGHIRRLPYFGASTTGEDEDKTTRIVLDINPQEVDLEVGDLMRVTVILEQKDNVLWLPPQAIRTFEGRKFVVIQEGEYQARVDVKIGIEAEDRVEILEGLDEGQIVIGP
jgi:RND family efflux transporter MFP subunit